MIIKYYISYRVWQEKIGGTEQKTIIGFTACSNFYVDYDPEGSVALCA